MKYICQKNRLFMKLKFLSVLFLLSIMSCKDKVDNPEVLTDQEVKSNHLSIALDLLIKEDDSLQIFYSEDLTPNYNDLQSVWSVVKGSDVNQTVSFDLPSDVYPTHLRLDFGVNKNQKEIKVNAFKMTYGDKSFETKDTLFFQFFEPVNQIDWDRKNAVAKIVTPAGEKHDPSFYPRDTFKEELKKLLK
jgi:hypothetical protein